TRWATPPSSTPSTTRSAADAAAADGHAPRLAPHRRSRHHSVLRSSVPAHHPRDHLVWRAAFAQGLDRVFGSRRVVMLIARAPDALPGEVAREFPDESLVRVVLPRSPRARALLLQRGLSDLQPVSHPHLAEHGNGRDEMLTGRVPATAFSAEQAQAEMAARDERPHLELVRDAERAPIAGLGRVEIRWIIAPCDLAREPERVRLVAALLIVTRHRERAPGRLASLLELAGEQIRFSEPRHAQRLAREEAQRIGPRH